MQQRPMGITVLSVLAVIGGILSFAAGITLMLGGGLGSVAGASSGGTVLVLGSVMFATGLVSLLLGYGFWVQKRWAWGAAFVVYGAAVVADLASVFLAGASPLSVAVPIAIAAFVMWYLLQPKTREALGH